METFPRETKLDPWYVTGFVDGEGAFTFSRNGRAYGLYFSIKLTGKDEALLVAIRDFFGGSGKIYKVAHRAAPTPRSGYTKAASLYRVTRLDELERVAAHFDAYPLAGMKAEAFRIWRLMLEAKRATFRKTPTGELHELARQLSAASPRNAAWE